MLSSLVDCFEHRSYSDYMYGYRVGGDVAVQYGAVNDREFSQVNSRRGALAEHLFARRE